MSRLSEALARNRREVLAAERQGANRMVAVYGETYTRLSRQLDTLIERIVEAQAQGKTISRDWLFREARFRLLLQQVQEELDRFVPNASASVVESQRRAVELAATHSQELIRMAPGPLPQGKFIPDGFTRFNPETVTALVGRTAAGSPVRDLFEQFGKDASVRARAVLVETIIAGQPATVAAKALREELQIPLARALTISRTEVLGAYREASIKTYEDNSEIVNGWRWAAALNSRTCAMCLAMDGRVFANSVPFGSHPNCRCTPVPETKPWSELGEEFAGIPDRRVALPKGSEWFEKQPDRVKQKILSPRKYELYKEGKLSLDDLIGYRVDKSWGPNRWERSLKHIEQGRYKPTKAALGGLPESQARAERLVSSVPYEKDYPKLTQALGTILKVDDYGTEIVKNHLDDLDKIPESVLERVRKAGLKQVHVGDKVMTGLDDNQHLTNVRPRGWPEGFTWDTVAGSYQNGVVTAGRGDHGSVSLPLHEFGHAIGDLLGLDNDPRIIEIHKKVYDKLDPYLQQEGPGGYAGRQELLAEGFAMYLKRGQTSTSLRYGKEFTRFLEEFMK